MTHSSKLAVTRKGDDVAVPEAQPSDVVIDVRAATKAYDMWTSPAARLTAPLMRRAARLPLPARLKTKLRDKADAQNRVFQALHATDFQVRRGESWGIIGVNGSGKSTLLKMISGSLRPTSGRIEVEGKVAILDFSSGLNPDFTGRENVFLKAAMFGMPRKIVEERYDAITAFADIGDFIDVPVKTYSSGMMARLGFAILAHVDADILITDEALAVGDAFFVQKCMRWIREFIQRGTFIMVSHSINDIMSLCEKAVWLEDGRIRSTGSAKDVGTEYMASAMSRRTRRFNLKTDAKQAGTAEAEDAQETDFEIKSDTPSSGAPAGGDKVKAISQPELAEVMNAHPPKKIRDQRLEFMNRSPWRNDIETTSFNPDAAAFGEGGAEIFDLRFEDAEGNELSWIVGGEFVSVVIYARASRRIEWPLLGFQVKDRLGQTLFADNTLFVNEGEQLEVAPDEIVSASFSFQMPLLPTGEYAIDATIAEGMTDADATVLHTLHAATTFQSRTSGPRHGLVGIPMHRISLAISNADNA